MTTVGATASRAIWPSCAAERALTAKRLERPGTKSTAASSTTPSTKAPRLYQLPAKPSLKMEARPRQLKPWNRRARVRVAKAMVLASAAPPAERPR